MAPNWETYWPHCAPNAIIAWHRVSKVSCSIWITILKIKIIGKSLYYFLIPCNTLCHFKSVSFLPLILSCSPSHWCWAFLSFLALEERVRSIHPSPKFIWLRQAKINTESWLNPSKLKNFNEFTLFILQHSSPPHIWIEFLLSCISKFSTISIISVISTNATHHRSLLGSAQPNVCILRNLFFYKMSALWALC